MSPRTQDEVREAVRARYGDIAKTESSCCSTSCCTEEDRGSATSSAAHTSVERCSSGSYYTEAEEASAPQGSNLGLSCGNPLAIASLRPGETVLDLGSGAGFDCFLAAHAVGPEGKVIGVDMTPEMIAKARGNAERAEVSNVEFRLGEIEHLPVADGSVDVILSNCVINLSPEKSAVFREAHRVLRWGGRLAISDIVAKIALPAEVAADLDQVAGCIGGAVSPQEIVSMLKEAGFRDVRVNVLSDFAAPGVASASIEAVKLR
jgi:ubiquinone/menaquinone biosynthesis C-methylase UbiE